MDVIAYLSCILVGLLGSMIYFFYRKGDQLEDKSHLLLFVLLFIVLLFESFASYKAKVLHQSNLIIYNVFFLYVETIFFLRFFYWHMGHKKRRILVYVTVIFLLTGIANSLFVQDIFSEFQNISLAFAILIILSCCISFFFDIFSLKRYRNRSLLSIPEFWIVNAVFFFYSSGFVFFIPIHLFEGMESHLLNLLFNINRILAGLMYLIIGFAFYSPFIFKNKLSYQ